jgi:hypothetical protein
VHNRIGSRDFGGNGVRTTLGEEGDVDMVAVLVREVRCAPGGDSSLQLSEDKG